MVSKGFLAMTVACARCHDHKFDPIPTKDYYALHGVFASIDEPKEKPVISQAGKEAAAEFQKKMAAWNRNATTITSSSARTTRCFRKQAGHLPEGLVPHACRLQSAEDQKGGQ